MICADFLAGSASEQDQTEVLVLSLEAYYLMAIHESLTMYITSSHAANWVMICQII